MIGERVLELRLERGWRQVDLAERTGLNLSTIRNVERGHHRPFRLTARLLAQAFEIDVEELLREPGRPAE